MAAINFGNFAPVSPQLGDYFIGYRNTQETRTTLDSLTSLSTPYINNIFSLNQKSILSDSVYTSTRQTSSLWNSTYQTTNSVSGNWNQSYTYVFQTSARLKTIDFQMTDVTIFSGGWDSTYTDFSENSASIVQAICATADYRTLSAVLYNASNVVVSLSGNWNSVYSNVLTESANWIGGNQAYTYVYNFSAENMATIYHMTDVKVFSGSWDSTYTNFSENSATIVQAICATVQYRGLSADLVTYSNLTTNNIVVSGIAITQSLCARGDQIKFINLPSSPAGLQSGTLWNDNGALRVAL